MSLLLLFRGNDEAVRGRSGSLYFAVCGFGVAEGLKLDASPRFADVVDGKLYLFLNADVFEAYKKDKTGIIAQAEAEWPDMEHRTVEDVNGL